MLLKVHEGSRLLYNNVDSFNVKVRGNVFRTTTEY